MKCDICRERPAVIFVQQVSKGISIELHLCEKCAKERGFSTTGNKIDISLGSLFSEILENADGKTAKTGACPNCGCTITDIRKNHKAGCAECYAYFTGDIISILRSEGVELSYTGEFPVTPENFRVRQDTENIEKELQRAVEHEDYELAAYYRDRLKSLGEDSE